MLPDHVLTLQLQTRNALNAAGMPRHADRVEAAKTLTDLRLAVFSALLDGVPDALLIVSANGGRVQKVCDAATTLRELTDAMAEERKAS